MYRIILYGVEIARTRDREEAERIARAADPCTEIWYDSEKEDK